MNDKKLESRQFFDKVAPRYDQHRYAGQASWIHKRILAEAPPFGRALDIGCGTGTLLGLLKMPNAKLAGADLSEKMIAEAKSKLGDGVDLRVADAENLPWEKDSFDVVVCALSFHHYPNPTKALAEMRRVLRAGGHLIIGDAWVPFPLGHLANWLLKLGKEGDVRIYSKADLGDMAVEAGFVEVQTRVSFTFQLMHARAPGKPHETR